MQCSNLNPSMQYDMTGLLCIRLEKLPSLGFTHRDKKKKKNRFCKCLHHLPLTPHIDRHGCRTISAAEIARLNLSTNRDYCNLGELCFPSCEIQRLPDALVCSYECMHSQCMWERRTESGEESYR